MSQVIAYKTLDLIDAIENRGLTPQQIAGCVGCVLEAGSDMQGLPRAACIVERIDNSYNVHWPDHRWTELVEDYLALIHDESGVADATGE